MSRRYSGWITGLLLVLGVMAWSPAAHAIPTHALQTAQIRGAGVHDAQIRERIFQVREGEVRGAVGPRYAPPATAGPYLYRGPRIYRAPRRTYRGIYRYRAPRYSPNSPVVPYTYDRWDRGYDHCVWVGRRAKRTGKRYWWRRYKRCARYYFH